MKRILNDRLFQGALELLSCSKFEIYNVTTNDINLTFDYSLLQHLSNLRFDYNVINIKLKFHKENNDGDYIIHIDFKYKENEYKCKTYLTKNIYDIKYVMGFAEELIMDVIRLIKLEICGDSR